MVFEFKANNPISSIVVTRRLLDRGLGFSGY